MNRIDIHADDYAISPNSSNEILSCLRVGKLDSISVLVNMSCYEEYADRYKQERLKWSKEPLLTIHLNFMEGHCVAKPSKLPHLVNEKGYFNISWGSLFVWNYSPKKFNMIKKELKAEIRAQIRRFREGFGMEYGDNKPLRFDGHQHTQMIPVVYWALLEVIVEEGLTTEYVRITKEPIIPYVKKLSLWKTYKPVNIVKNILLNMFAPGMEKTLRQSIPGCTAESGRMLLWGVLMSGLMDEDRVAALLPEMRDYAARKGRTLEILFHPGTVLEEELSEEFSNKSANGFHVSEGRHVEYEAVMALPLHRNA